MGNDSITKQIYKEKDAYGSIIVKVSESRRAAVKSLKEPDRSIQRRVSANEAMSGRSLINATFGNRKG